MLDVFVCLFVLRVFLCVYGQLLGTEGINSAF